MFTDLEWAKIEEGASMREVWDLRVYVVGGGHQYVKMFFDAGFKGARSVEDAHIVCFTGGEDVDPSFYNEEKIEGVHTNIERDKFEATLYGECLALKKPMIGICRGSQFLTVMNGGKLWQDVNNHCVKEHSVVDFRNGDIVKGMTSTHHQQMRPVDGAEIIAVAELSTRKQSYGEVIARAEPECDDIEVVWHPDSLSLCFQPHPEFSHGPCRNYFLELVDEYVIPAC